MDDIFDVIARLLAQNFASSAGYFALLAPLRRIAPDDAEGSTTALSCGMKMPPNGAVFISGGEGGICSSRP